MLNIVDSHHKVLLSWAEYRASLKVAPKLITLDHHTDTSPPFRRFIRENCKDKNNEHFLNTQNNFLKAVDFKNLDTVKEAIEKLNNDEHIVTAIKTDIISSAFVIAHNAADTDLETYKEHKIACRNLIGHDQALESSLLDESFIEFNKVLQESHEESLFASSYILDIDLDYFNTFKSVSPDEDQTFKTLIKNAGLITIATEPEYVKNCALDKGLTSDFLLKSLKDRFLPESLNCSK